MTVTESSRKYTAFTTEYDKYEFHRIPFGIHAALKYFTLMINMVFESLEFYFYYLEDIIVFAKF